MSYSLVQNLGQRLSSKFLQSLCMFLLVITDTTLFKRVFRVLSDIQDLAVCLIRLFYKLQVIMLPCHVTMLPCYHVTMGNINVKPLTSHSNYSVRIL